MVANPSWPGRCNIVMFCSAASMRDLLVCGDESARAVPGKPSTAQSKKAHPIIDNLSGSMCGTPGKQHDVELRGEFRSHRDARRNATHGEYSTGGTCVDRSVQKDGSGLSLITASSQYGP
jgi:hypothetical protein